MNIMMQLGAFQFSLSTAAYQTFRRSAEYRWSSQNTVGIHPSQQYIGPGEQSINLDGVIYPEFRGSKNQIARMRDIAGQGEPLLLVDGYGFVHEYWCIKRIEETHSIFNPDGSPRKIDFNLELTYYGDNVQN